MPPRLPAFCLAPVSAPSVHRLPGQGPGAPSLATGFPAAGSTRTLVGGVLGSTSPVGGLASAAVRGEACKWPADSFRAPQGAGDTESAVGWDLQVRPYPVCVCW